MLSKTVIIGCNLHGEIMLDKNNNPFVEPLKLKSLIQLNAVTPGITNIATFTTYDKLGRDVDSFIEDNPKDWDADYSENDLLSYVKKIRRLLIKSNKEERKDIEQLYKKNAKQQNTGLTDRVATNMKGYVHSLDKSYNISAFGQGDKILNKTFYKFDAVELENVEMEDDDVDLEDAFFNKLFVYNNEDKMEIFDFLDSLGHPRDELTLFNLIDFLEGLGVENLILIDLSCEVFVRDDNFEFTSRDIRSKRNFIEKQNLRNNRTLSRYKSTNSTRSNSAKTDFTNSTRSNSAKTDSTKSTRSNSAKTDSTNSTRSSKNKGRGSAKTDSTNSTRSSKNKGRGRFTKKRQK
uniref:Uncharacterized protein n=1 Tax=viral metagenome TaxID=1070528 RepID=A0A6C0HWU6_9ZZZZ